MADFENWDNDPPDDLGYSRTVTRSHHSAPPHVERIMRADDLRRERSAKLLVAAILMILSAISICVWWWL
jgi:hypothetical protein